MSNTQANTDMVPVTNFMPTSEAPPPSPQTSTGTPTRAALGSRHPAPLRRDQKAAIIVRLIQSGQLELPLGELETNTLAQLVRATAGLSFVSEADTLQVISDFLTEIESQAIYFRPGLDRAMGAFRDQLSETVETLLMSDAPPDAPEDPWPAINLADALIIAKILADETPQVCGVALAKLPSGKAAEILAELEPELARAATLAATYSGSIPAKTVMEIGLAISRALGSQAGTGALPGDPVERVGAILNFAPGPTREKLLGSIESLDPLLAERMRKIMFTFADIPDRLEVRDVAKVVRAIDNDVLLTTLVGGQQMDSETVEFILNNLSKRLVEQLREEMSELGEVKVKDAEAAMNVVIQTVKDMESSGEITLIVNEE